MVDFGLYLTYFMILVALLAAFIFPLVYLLKNPEDLKKSAMGIGFIVVVFVISYFTASGEFFFRGIEKYELSAQSIKLVGTGLNMFYILALVAIVAAVYSEVSSYFK